MERPQAPALALLAAACAWVSACGLNQAGVTPPTDTIAYPASAVMDRNAEWLFVTNANADLRYNDGTLMAFNLSRAAADRPAACTTDADCLAPSTCELGVNRCTTRWGNCRQVNDANPRADEEHFCCWDVVNHKREVLNCDERYYVGSDAEIGIDPVTGKLRDIPLVPSDERGESNVRIGSFAAAMLLQAAKCPKLKPNPANDADPPPPQPLPPVDCDVCANYASNNDRLLIGVRGDTSLTFIEVNSVDAGTPPELRCIYAEGLTQEGQRILEAPGGFAACDEEHRVIRAHSGLASPSLDPMPPDIPLPDEPYALMLDEHAGLLFIGHLTGNAMRAFSGGFSLFDIGPRIAGDQGDSLTPLPAPRFIAPFPSPFPPTNVGAVGITALDVRPDAWGWTVYASSRFVPQVAGLATTATCPLEGLETREIAAFPNGAVYTSPVGGTETRGVEIIDGRHTFVLQRSPPSLIEFLDGVPTAVLETCSSPTFLDRFDVDETDGIGPQLFVTCFTDGEVYVFDPSVPRLVKSIPVGRGPAGLVLDKMRKVLYVVGFGDNNISVVDLRPGEPTEYRVIQRIGFPRTTPR
jgi:hypothetical protein